MRYSIRAIAGAVLAGACLALAACSGGSPDAASTGQGPRPVQSGTVTVREGNKVICEMTVVNGKGTCQVPASQFGGVGSHTIVGEYSGKGYRNAKSQPVTVTVTSAPTAGP